MFGHFLHYFGTDIFIIQIQIDGAWRRVYIKFVHNERMRTILEMTRGQLEYHHETGELTTIIVENAGMRVRRIRIANLAPEISDITLRGTLSKFENVKNITE